MPANNLVLSVEPARSLEHHDGSFAEAGYNIRFGPPAPEQNLRLTLVALKEAGSMLVRYSLTALHEGAHDRRFWSDGEMAGSSCSQALVVMQEMGQVAQASPDRTVTCRHGVLAPMQVFSCWAIISTWLSGGQLQSMPDERESR